MSMNISCSNVNLFYFLVKCLDTLTLGVSQGYPKISLYFLFTHLSSNGHKKLLAYCKLFTIKNSRKGVLKFNLWGFLFWFSTVHNLLSISFSFVQNTALPVWIVRTKINRLTKEDITSGNYLRIEYKADN